MSLRELAWLAGLLEGEGSFVTLKHSIRNTVTPCVQMSITDVDIAEKVAALFRTKASRFQPKWPGAKPAWIVRKSGPRAIGWMLTLYSLMGERRQSQIRAALAQYSPPRKFKRVEAA